MILWGRGSSSNVQRVLFLCGELGVAPERREVGGAFGGLDDPTFRALTPVGRIPFLQDADIVVWESHAILRYLASTYGPALYGSDAAARAPVDTLLDWASGSLWPPIRTMFQIGFAKGLPLDDAGLVGAREGLDAALKVLEAELQRRAFVAGPQFSIADITVAVSLNRLLGMDAAYRLPDALEAWLWRVTDRAAFAPVAEGEATELNRWREARARLTG